MGVIVGVAVIVTMISFGLGLQRNTVSRFKELDLFNEITVFGRSLASIASAGFNKEPGNANSKPPEERVGNRSLRPDKAPQRALNDAAIAEIAQIPGVAYVEPTITFNAYVRSNGRAFMRSIGGAVVPNTSSRFKEYSAGGMIASADADEAVVDEEFARDFGYTNPSDAIGKTFDLLAPDKQKDEGDAPSFFGLPLEDDGEGSGVGDAPSSGLAARTFRIVGVLKAPDNNGPRFRGMMPVSDIYIPLRAARSWTLEYRDNLSAVALELARQSGAIGENETGGYGSAVLRVTDPVVLTDVRKRLTELGFGSFSIVDQLEQLRTVFLIINSALGLLGGISLLVASFGIANTMIMSILERTREIGIMKAIGAEDREIKLIFFVEAAVIGLTGGIVGSLVAWAIDGAANRLAYRFILKPQGASYIDFFALPPYLWLGAILFAVIISILAALYPATRAARIDPVKALRHD
jgi:ABC-type antimicrobial peptide transport system permease subunit